MKLCSFIILLIFLSACERRNGINSTAVSNSNYGFGKNTTSPSSNIINAKSSDTSNYNGIKNSASLDGIWRALRDESRFQIDKDSIFYMDDDKGYKISLRNDELTIHLDNYDVKEKVIFVGNDSFVVLLDNQRLTYLKMH
jgi:hypothetical protein